MATLAPNWAKRTAIAWPMPELPPATRTLRPFRPGMLSAGDTVGAAVDMGAFSLADGGCRRWSIRAPGRYTAQPNARFRVGRCLVQTKLHALVRPRARRAAATAAVANDAAAAGAAARDRRRREHREGRLPNRM